jgi:hypothetical protein
MVAWLAAPATIELGLNETDPPVGRPVTARVSGPGRPPTTEVVTVKLSFPPAVTVPAEADSARVNSAAEPGLGDADELLVLGRGEDRDGEADGLVPVLSGVAGSGICTGTGPAGNPSGRDLDGPVPVPPCPPIATTSTASAITTAPSQASCQELGRRQASTPG